MVRVRSGRRELCTLSSAFPLVIFMFNVLFTFVKYLYISVLIKYLYLDLFVNSFFHFFSFGSCQKFLWT